jgi:isopentenyl-diphosphate delta-isomerase type 1
MPLDNASELFYLVDDQDSVLGSIARAKAHQDRNTIHRAVDIILTNSLDQVLVQKRSQFKDTNPGFWTLSASGHVTYGQSYDEAALRELEEELGVRVPLTFLKKTLFRSEREQEYTSIYLGTLEDTPTHFDTTEVEAVKWVPIAKLPEFVANNQVSPFAQLAFKEVGYLGKLSLDLT